MRANLVDEYVLLIHATTSTTGVLIATYQPAQPTAGRTT
jgi:hypothetical protein